MHASNLLLGVFILIGMVGCQSSVPVTLIGPEGRDALLTASDVVVEGRVLRTYARSDLTMREQVSWGQPTEREQGWVTVFEMRVERTLKGRFGGDQLKMRASQTDVGKPRVLAGVVEGAKLRVGWRENWLGDRRNVQILILAGSQPSPTTAAAPRR